MIQRKSLIHTDKIAKWQGVYYLNKFLQELNLSANKIGDDGCIELMKMLSKNNSLTKLNLQDNILSDKGCLEIGKMLSKNKSLTRIKFEW